MPGCKLYSTKSELMDYNALTENCSNFRKLTKQLLSKLQTGGRHDMPSPRPASGDTIYVMYAYMDRSPLLYVHVGLPVQPTEAAWWPWPLTFDVESGVRVTCDMGYLCANFSLPRHLCSRVRPDVRNRQTDVRRLNKASLNASVLWGDIIKVYRNIRKAVF